MYPAVLAIVECLYVIKEEEQMGWEGAPTGFKWHLLASFSHVCKDFFVTS